MTNNIMNNPNFADQSAEQLSALMDGELGHDELRFLLRGVDAQSDLAKRWSSYHIISASLRREFIAVDLPNAFSAGILTRIDAEDSASQQVAFGSGQLVRRRGMKALRWVGGGAIAAAVAVVALVVSRPVGDNAALTTLASSASPVQQSASRQSYLPLQLPLAGPNGFKFDDVSPASYESLPGLPGYYAPNRRILSRADLSTAQPVPYAVYVVPAQYQAVTPANPAQTSAPAHP